MQIYFGARLDFHKIRLPGMLVHLLILFSVFSVAFCQQIVKLTEDELIQKNQFVQFVNGQVVYNEIRRAERYRNLVMLIMEANTIFKFKNGRIFINDKDRNFQPETPIAKNYYTNYDHRFHHLYANITGPDFIFLNWGSALIGPFAEEVRKISAASLQPAAVSKLGWIGNINSPLPDVKEFKTRPLLLEFTNNHTDYFDFKHLPANGFNSPNYLSLPDLVQRYAFLLDIGGNGYSGRLKLLLFSRRPIFVVARDHVEFFNWYLVPYVHYIPVQQDLSDLVSQYEWALKHPQLTSAMAENAFAFATNHFTHEKVLHKMGAVITHLLDHN